MIISILFVILGLSVLTVGAEMLVRGAVRLSVRLGIPLIIVGLTVVAFGTSAPELAVSVLSAWVGKGDMAVGNVMGSNIFNILVVLGICSLIVPSVVHAKIVKADIPMMILASALVYVLCLDGQLDSLEGGIVFSILLIFLALQYFAFRSERSKEVQEEVAELLETDSPDEKNTQKLLVSIFFVLFGVLGLGLGSHWFVQGGTEIAQFFGVSDLVIGLSLMAFGTSLPELATAISAALKKQNDIVVGNVVGSNIFNILGVFGLTAAINRPGIAISEQALNWDIPVAVVVALICLPICWTKFKIHRAEGFALLVAYGFYLFIVFKGA